MVSQAEPLPSPGVALPVSGPPFARPDAALIEQLQKVSSATASAQLHGMGIRQSYIEGPTARHPGTKVVGSALTLQFMPQREDVLSGVAQEEVEKFSALWAVLEAVQPGDVLTVQAYGDPFTGCFGEMLVTYFRERGGAGLVIDGYLRDWPHVRDLDVPIWSRGNTPNYASQSGLVPWAYNVPIACSRVLVLPGDIIIADDDGAVLIPVKMAPRVIERTLEKEEKETFSRQRLAEGGALRKYYPLTPEGREEFLAWKAAKAAKAQES